jgi:hypothetical protein
MTGKITFQGGTVEELPWVQEKIDAATATLRAELDALRKDAERYRWLRDKPIELPALGLDVATWSHESGEGLRGDDLDAAVDAEMAASK